MNDGVLNPGLLLLSVANRQEASLLAMVPSHPYVFTIFPISRPSVLILKNGGDDGVRTHDPLLAGQVLSQLSYTPIFMGFPFPKISPLILEN